MGWCCGRLAAMSKECVARTCSSFEGTDKTPKFVGSEGRPKGVANGQAREEGCYACVLTDGVGCSSYQVTKGHKKKTGTNTQTEEQNHPAWRIAES